jgi:hypothetical protein
VNEITLSIMHIQISLMRELLYIVNDAPPPACALAG